MTAIMAPRGDQNLQLAQDALGRLIVVGVAAAPVPMDLKWVLNALLTPANPVITGVYDAAGNRMPAGDAPARQIYVEGSGLNTNPERYIQDNKFSSVPIVRAGGVATLLYGVASPVAHRRTAGLSTTIWWVWYHNLSGGAATVWLEAPGGTLMSTRTQLADNQTIVLNVKPLDIGDQDIFVNASANNVEAQIGGLEV